MLRVVTLAIEICHLNFCNNTVLETVSDGSGAKDVKYYMFEGL